MSKLTVDDLDTKKTLSFAVSVNPHLEGLKDMIASLGYDLHHMTPQDKAAIADKLSRLAGQSPAWTWRYIHNVLLEKIDPSQRMNEAILKMLAILDGANPLMVEVNPVQVYAKNVKPGAVVLAGSRSCANLACPMEFVPIVPRQRFCSSECRKSDKHRHIK